jgi:16S rRNA (cytidine1402-2'-O)-methyltransferase
MSSTDESGETASDERGGRIPGPPPARGGPLEPGLYVVSTPIGNLRDITYRAVDVLAGCDLVLAEDTRVTGKLLSALGLSRPLQAYHDHNADQVRPQVLERLAAGGRVALVSDAGTPLVSDPGYKLVRDAAAAGAAVRPVPGASAPLAALTAAGLPTDRFLFAGFPPRGAARRAWLEGLASVRATLVLFETGPRLAESLADMAAAFGDRDAAVARELTKLFETVYRGRLSALAADPALQAPKGEIVVLVAPGEAAAAGPEEVDAALRDALTRGGPGEAASAVAKALGLPRRDLYRRALALKT